MRGASECKLAVDSSVLLLSGLANDVYVRTFVQNLRTAVGCLNLSFRNQVVCARYPESAAVLS